MIIKKFVDKDSRSAMAKVREEFGAEAVVLSSREVSAGFEMVAAANYDEYDVSEELKNGEEDAFGSPAQSVVAPRIKERKRTQQAARHADSNDVQFQQEQVIHTSLSYVAEIPTAANQSSDVKEQSSDKDVPTLKTLQTELAQLRHLMENELSKFSKNSNNTARSNRAKARASMKRHLIRAGFSDSLSEQLTGKIDLTAAGAEKWRGVMETLSKRISPCSKDLIASGGIAAFIGQPGVGKTTVISKLAMNKLLRDGMDTVGLISAGGIKDPRNTRLRDFAESTGIAFIESHNATHLKSAIEEFSSKELVLIDTQGMAENDLRLVIQSAEFRIVDHPIDTYLVLSGESDLTALLNTVSLFERYSPVGVVLTKLDISHQLSSSVEALAVTKLPIAYLCNGEEIPTDIRVGKPRELVKYALKASHRKVSQRSREFLDKAHVANLSVTAAAAKRPKQAARLAAG